ncbi:MAG: AbrB family transcriptional regulator [Rhodospirillales bacterium]|nr:AbrB family transcriptional regulator [Rhodospirillales bacterium]
MAVVSLPRPAAALLALALGAAGGWAASLLNLPLAWMIGAMAATTAAAVLGAPLVFSPGLRSVMVAVLGLMLGSRFTPAILDHIGEWAVSIAGLLIYTTIAGLGCMAYFRRFGGFDRTTAYFAAMPGGLSEMILVGTSLGGDARLIALVHASRLLLVVSSLPFALQLLLGYEVGAAAPGADTGAASPADLAVLAACGLAGYFGARALKLPAGAMLGPMVLSAALHLGGVTEAQLPDVFVAAAQVVIGTAVGCRFAGTAPGLLARTAVLALGSTAILLVTALVFAAAVAAITGLPATALVIAYSPGGVAEMSLIAIALALDPAFVATHHLLRIFMIVVLAPLAFRRLAGGAK